MNTMADGAAQRLDAQIADALFGQPGMSKVDVANRLRQLRGISAPLLADVGHPVTASLAGQGDVPYDVARDLLADAYNAGRNGIGFTEQVMRLDDALAARQPVGEVSVKKVDANNYCLILRALGMEEEGDPVAEVKALIGARDRQPVGQEPITVEAVATVRVSGDGERRIDWLTEGGIADLDAGDVLIVAYRPITDDDGSGEVYAATPAQAVDPADPWRGLYSPDLMPKLDGVNLYHVAHPDLPSWPKDEDEERGIGPLVTAQGFAIEVVFGEYPDDDGEEVDYCAWLASWTPDAPAGADWRLACIQDTEDGPAAFYVLPLALIDSKAVGK